MNLIGEKKIDKVKLAALKEISKDVDVEDCKKILADFGYKSSAEIKVKNYKEICDCIRALKQ